MQKINLELIKIKNLKTNKMENKEKQAQEIYMEQPFTKALRKCIQWGIKIPRNDG